MSTKYICVFIDDFTSRAYGFPGVTVYDYAAWETVFYYDDYYYDLIYGPYNYAYDIGDFDRSQVAQVLSTGYYNLLDITGDSGVFADSFVSTYQEPATYSGYNFYYGGYQYEDRTSVSVYNELNLYPDSTSWTSPQHGDWVLNAFYDQLDDTSIVESICIDIDFDLGHDTNYLWSQSGGTYVLDSIINAAFADFYDPAYDYALVGISASLTTTSVAAQQAVAAAMNDDAIVVQSAPNVTSQGISWGPNLPNVINVGAWNVNENGYSLAVNPNDQASVDIYANGYTTNSSWGSNFGTSFATPTVFAELVNLGSQFYTPPPAGTEQPDLTETEYTAAIDYFTDAISTDVEVLLSSGGTTRYETWSVMTDEVTDGSVEPDTVVTGAGADYQIQSAQLATENLPPTTNDDWLYIDEDSGTASISVSSVLLNNDTDYDGDSLAVTRIGSASYGSAVLVSASEIQYTPDPNFAGIDTFSYTVSDGNGGTASGILNISVAETADPVGTVTDSDSGTNTVNESDPATTTVGITAVAVDPDPTNNGITYGLSIDAGGRFTIDSSTGVVTIADPSLIDYETNTSHMIEVTATSDDGTSTSTPFNIAISDNTDEFDVGTPTDSDVVPNAVSETNSVDDYTGLTVFASDLDSADGVSYALTHDAEGRFTINPTTGVVTVADPSLFDYETDTSHTIEVTATSDDGSSITQSFTIAVTDDPEFKFVPSTAVTDLPLAVTDSEATQVFEHATDDLRPEGLFELPGGGFLTVSVRDSDHLLLTKLAASGEIDTTFGSSGTVEYDLSITGLTGFNEVTMTSSGKVIVGGGSGSTSYLIVDPSLARGSGMFTEYGGGVSLPAYSNFAAGTAGTYALALVNLSGVDSYVIGRMNADGYPDASFGGIGIKFLAQNPPTDFAIPSDAFYGYSRIDEADDGSIIISSAVDNGSLILKVDPLTGQPVGTFGNNGYIYLEGTAASQLLATDAVYVASQVNLNPGTYMSVSKIDLTTGELDSGFGSGGTLNLSVGATSADEWESLTSPMIALSDGSILLSGYVDSVVGQGGGFGASGYDYDNWFVKMNPDGSLDTDFGTDGYLLLNNGTGYEHPRSVIQASDGDIWAFSETNQNFLEFDSGLSKYYAEVNRFDLSGDLVTKVGLATDLDPTTNQVSEAGSDGDLAGVTAAASDSDGDVVSYTLSDDGGGRFAIDSLTGVISVADVSLLDYSQDESHTVTVQSTSADGSSSYASFSIAVVENISPTVVADVATVSEEGSLTFDVLANDSDTEGATLSLVSGTADNGGAVAVVGNQISYQPAQNFNGTETIYYTVTDGIDTSDGTLTVSVTPVNDDPIAADDSETVAEDSDAHAFSVLSNDTDVDLDTLTITSAVAQSGGTATVSPDGTQVIYQSALNFHGQETVIYTISDGAGGTDTGTLTVNVAAVNDAPTGSPTATLSPGTEDVPYVLSEQDLVDGFTDVEGDPISAHTIAGFPGTLTDNQDGTYTIDAGQDTHGSWTLSYQVTDDKGASTTATLGLTIAPVNDDPVAVADILGMSEDASSILIGVLANDTDVENDTLSVSAPVADNGGTVSVVGNQISYQPAPDFHGTETITYTVDDGNGGTDTGTVTVTVAPVNDDPTGIASAALVDGAEDTPYTVTEAELLQGFGDIDGDSLSTSNLMSSSGTVTSNGGGNYTVDPALNYSGTVTLSYDVIDGNGGTVAGTQTLTLNPVNDPPVSVDDGFTVLEDSAATTIDVLGNDTDVEGHTLTISNVSSDQGGALTVIGNQISYQPAAGFNGIELVTYTVDDGNGGTDTGTLTVNVRPPDFGNRVQGTDTILNLGAEHNLVSEQLGSSLQPTIVSSNLISNGNDPIATYAFGQGNPFREITIQDSGSVGGSVKQTNDLKYLQDVDSVQLSNGNVATVYTAQWSTGTGFVDNSGFGVGLIITGPEGNPVPGDVTQNVAGPLRVNTYYSSDQNQPSITLLPGDKLLVTWTSYAQDADNWKGIFGQILDADGNHVGPEFHVNQTHARNQTDSVSGVLETGEALIAWVSDHNYFTAEIPGTLSTNFFPGSVRFRIQDTDTGNWLTDEVALAVPVQDETTLSEGYIDPIVSAMPDGTFVVSWLVQEAVFSGSPPSSVGMTDPDQIGFQKIAADGTLIGSASYLDVPNMAGSYDVQVLADGSLAVTWDDTTQFNEIGASGKIKDYEIYMQLVGPDLSQLGVPVDISAERGRVENPDLVLIDQDTLAVSWEGRDKDLDEGSDNWIALRDIEVDYRPTMSDQTIIVDQDQALSGSVVASDHNLGESFSFSATDTPSWLTLNPDGSLSGTPGNDEVGSHDFSVTVTDSSGLSASSTVTVQVDNVNDAPDGVAIATLSDGTEDTAYVGTEAELLQGFNDIDGDTLSVSSLVSSSGTVSDNGDGTYTVNPALNENGTVTLDYDVVDGNGGIIAGTQSFHLDPVNDAPTPADDTLTVAEDATAVDVDVLGNDTDVEQDSLTISSVSTTGSGAVDTDGSQVSYQPTPDFHGTETVTYTVDDGNGGTDTATLTVTVSSVNDAPVSADDVLSISEDSSALSIDVLANDTDVENDALTVSSPVADRGGAVSVVGNQISYQPAPNFHGTETITYTVDDGNGGTDTGTVTVTVDPVNDAPDGAATAVLADGSEDTAYVVTEFELLQGFSDIDGDSLSVSNLVSSSGAATDNGDGTYTINPALNDNGQITLSYDVVDGHGGVVSGTRALNLAPVNDDPIGAADASLAAGVEDTPYQVSEAQLLQGFNDIDGDTLSVTNLVSSSGTVTDNGDSSFTVNPALNENGAVTLSYDVVDGNGGYVAGNQAFNLSPVNDSPIVEDESIIAAINSGGIQIDVLTNDSDVDLDQLSLTGVSSDQGGTVFVSGGKIVYSPATDFVGTETVSYTVSDGAGGSSGGTVVVSVVPNQAPEFTYSSSSTTVVENIDTTAVIEGISAAIDPDGDTLTYNLKGTDAGYFSVSALGAVTFNESPDYETRSSYDFTVVASDGTLEAEQVVKVNVHNDTYEQYDLGSTELASGGTFAGENLGDVMDGSSATTSLDMSGGGGNDVLTGGSANDIIDGGDGNDELNGGAGDDIIIAGTGLDRITGGDGIDTVVLESNAGDTVSVNLSRTWNYSGDGWNYIAEVENVTTGGGNDTLVGGDDLNVANVFDAGAGDDWVYAGGGDDVLIGGEGNDQLRGGSGNDTVVFKSDEDLSVNLNTEWQVGNRDTSEGTDRLVDIENVTTGGGNDTLVGNAEANILTGGGGDDTLTGGDGADLFRFNASEGMTTDVITDFTIGEDKLELVNDTDGAIAGAVINETGDGGSTVTWDELTIVLDVVVTQDDINPIV